uniref:Peroxidasin n=1 Tax=Lumbricus terrestris TaxID=6398 RepID=V9GWR0_LUMTE
MFLQLDHVPQVPEGTTDLDLRFNRILEIPPGTFRNLRNLNTLLLNNNQLTKLENGAFEGLSKLRYLYLYKNQISEIESQVFHGLGDLEQLYVHFNELEILQPGTFNGLPLLERLFLHNNRLKRLPQGIFSNLKALRRLRLDSNALVCDCEMLWLMDMLKDGHMQAAVTCDSPDEAAGKSLLSITDTIRCKKPEMISKPDDVEVAFGSTAYFACKAEGDPQPEIHWFRNSEEIRTNQLKDRGRYSILDDGTLMIENTQDSDKGVYECVARNQMGEAKARPVELRYLNDAQQTRPRIYARPQDLRLPEGEPATFECHATGHPRPFFTWLKNDLSLPQDPRLRIEVNGSLVITGLRLNDQGVYRCTAANSAGSVSETARLEVYAAPHFTKRPQDQRIVEGHSVFFSCDVTGEPLPRIHWNKDGIQVTDNSRVSINPSGTTLTIGAVRSGDGGLYECVAESLGGRRSASARLTVDTSVSPLIIRSPDNVQAPIGSRVQFDCQVTGNPRPTVKWQRDSIPIPLTTSHKHQVTPESSLVIQDVNRNDVGTYECIAENFAGTAHADAFLEVVDTRFVTFTPQHINRTVAETIRRVNAAINNTQRDFRDLHSRPRTAQDLQRLLRYPPSSALSISRAAEVFEQTLERLFAEVNAGATYNITHPKDLSYEELLTPTQLALVSSLSGCREHRRVAKCEDMCFHHKYRTLDGTCNNLRNPMMGSSLSTLLRLKPPRYENSFNLPVAWNPQKLYNGHRMPSARTVSLRFISTPTVTPDDQYTHMLMQWGQFIDHDLDFVPTAVSHARFSDGRFCNETCNSQSPCFPIPVAEDDPRVRRHRCIGFVRSSAMCGSGVTSVFFEDVIQREQLNLLTSYIDASMVYSFSDEDGRNLRDFSSNRGLLRAGIVMPSGKPLLPPNRGEFVDCMVDPSTAHVPCFQAGDHRTNEQLGLLSMHTLWFREHNRIASELLHINPHWDGDILYHEARKVVGAMMQHITFEHWLPKILGPVGMQLLGTYKGYDPMVDTRISNEFATAAFRFGHTLINPVLSRLNESFRPIAQGNLPLHKAFFAPFRIIEEGGIDPLLRGLFGVAAKRPRPGEFLNSELTERLFNLANEVAQDLAAFNLQRGRDHGIQSYNEYRRHCGLRPAATFDDFRTEIRSADVRRRLQEVYGHPNNVELFAGGIAEDVVDGGRIGPTFVCIIADQFKRLRDGDRFWYENPGVFTPAQLTELRHASLGRVICDSSDNIQEVQRDVFQLVSYPSGYLRCDSDKILHIDFKVWAQCCQDCSRSGDFRSITHHFRSRRSTDFTNAGEPDAANTNVTEETHRGGGGRAAEAENSVVPKDMVDQMTHMSQKMMDGVDQRIEGMEDMMKELQETVHKLTEKIRSLEKSVGNKKTTARKPKPPACFDEKGRAKQHGEKWHESDCRLCECKKNELECTEETCQVPSCARPVKVQGQCCPVCP